MSIDDEEGFGEKRLCVSCSKDDQIVQGLALRKKENWRGLANSPKKKKTAKYLGENKNAVKEPINFDRHKKIPIINNGKFHCLILVLLTVFFKFWLQLQSIDLTFSNQWTWT